MIDVVPRAFSFQFITMHDCVGFLPLGSQRGTTSVFPVFLFTNFAHASHTRASSGRFWTYLLTHSWRLSAVHVAGFMQSQHLKLEHMPMITHADTDPSTSTNPAYEAKA